MSYSATHLQKSVWLFVHFVDRECIPNAVPYAPSPNRPMHAVSGTLTERQPFLLNNEYQIHLDQILLTTKSLAMTEKLQLIHALLR